MTSKYPVPWGGVTQRSNYVIAFYRQAFRLLGSQINAFSQYWVIRIYSVFNFTFISAPSLATLLERSKKTSDQVWTQPLLSASYIDGSKLQGLLCIRVNLEKIEALEIFYGDWLKLCPLSSVCIQKSWSGVLYYLQSWGNCKCTRIIKISIKTKTKQTKKKVWN